MRFNDIDLNKAVLQEVILPNSNQAQKIFMLRLDLIHPTVHGNKWFKLKYNLAEAKEKGFDTILTFGGAYSNHIHAMAAAGKLSGFKTIGIIRGEEHLPPNPTLRFAFEQGMKLNYVGRSEYREKHMKKFQDKLMEKFGSIYIIPEGGTNLLAVKGCSEIPGLIKQDFDYITVACGTTGTFSGLTIGLEGRKQVIGFAVLKGGGFLIDQAKTLINSFSGKEYFNWKIDLDYHFGGYAKITRELIEFMNEFEKLNEIPLDLVYTGKMMYGIYDLCKKGFFQKGESIISLHTGGLQGIMGMAPKIEKIFTRFNNLCDSTPAI